MTSLLLGHPTLEHSDMSQIGKTSCILRSVGVAVLEAQLAIPDLLSARSAIKP